MKRRLVFIISILAISGALFAGGASESSDSGIMTLKVGTCAPESSTFVQYSLMASDKLEELSGGTMSFDVVGGGALGNIPQHFSQMNQGTLDLFVQGLDAPAALRGGEDFNILNVPFLFDDTEHFHAFVESDVLAGMMEKVRENNRVQFLGLIGDRPARSLATNKHAVRTPSDLDDLVIRVSESAIPIATWRAFGANVTTSSANSIYEGLQTGQFDGQENGIETMIVDGFMAVQDYYMVMDHTQQGVAVFIADATVEKLTEEQLGWIKEAIAYVFEETSQELWEVEVPSYYETIAENGVTIVDDVDIQAFQDIVTDLVPQFEGEYFSEGLYAQIRALAE